MAFDAQDLVKQALERHPGKLSVSCSFGKDSMVVLHMALKVNPDIPVTFANTGVEFPETLDFKERMKDEWNLNLYESKPIKSFWECVDSYGIPKPRGKDHAPKCCKYCKEKPMQILQESLGMVGYFTGLTSAESRQRKLIAMRYDNEKAPRMEYEDVKFCGQRWHNIGENMWKYHPIMYWSEKDVWDYHGKNNIPHNEVYDKWGGIYDRVGCLPCTAYLNWDKKLSVSHPTLFHIMKVKGDSSWRQLGDFM